MLKEHPANEVTAKIIAAAIEVHRHVGAGLLESVYEKCLVHELQRTGVKVETHVYEFRSATRISAWNAATGWICSCRTR